ncbi:hypothetical protein B0T22DRAFT_256573 [Podospora appendiculata]|uniref:Uncharacterized protein n=1 Tax=Podospora appendiculata TaxID=314037 RepID=A0AAE1C942_9PEZI|nr:hypothetical protein B0T22DRAFT_256573 [Podospora appendiculata]
MGWHGWLLPGGRCPASLVHGRDKVPKVRVSDAWTTGAFLPQVPPQGPQVHMSGACILYCDYTTPPRLVNSRRHWLPSLVRITELRVSHQSYMSQSILARRDWRCLRFLPSNTTQRSHYGIPFVFLSFFLSFTLSLTLDKIWRATIFSLTHSLGGQGSTKYTTEQRFFPLPPLSHPRGALQSSISSRHNDSSPNSKEKRHQQPAVHVLLTHMVWCASSYLDMQVIGFVCIGIRTQHLA